MLAGILPHLFSSARPDHPVSSQLFPVHGTQRQVDIRCDRSGDELLIGTGNDWMEILGCGMVNPRVLEMAGIDSEKYQGFAFGMGIEQRIAMLSTASRTSAPSMTVTYVGLTIMALTVSTSRTCCGGHKQ